jgi:hypothetical protein
MSTTAAAVPLAQYVFIKHIVLENNCVFRVFEYNSSRCNSLSLITAF